MTRCSVSGLEVVSSVGEGVTETVVVIMTVSGTVSVMVTAVDLVRVSVVVMDLVEVSVVELVIVSVRISTSGGRATQLSTAPAIKAMTNTDAMSPTPFILVTLLFSYNRRKAARWVTRLIIDPFVWMGD